MSEGLAVSAGPSIITGWWMGRKDLGETREQHASASTGDHPVLIEP